MTSIQLRLLLNAPVLAFDQFAPPHGSKSQMPLVQSTFSKFAVVREEFADPKAAFLDIRFTRWPPFTPPKARVVGAPPPASAPTQYSMRHRLYMLAELTDQNWRHNDWFGIQPEPCNFDPADHARRLALEPQGSGPRHFPLVKAVLQARNDKPELILKVQP